jgi:hypothetical protein
MNLNQQTREPYYINNNNNGEFNMNPYDNNDINNNDVNTLTGQTVNKTQENIKSNFFSKLNCNISFLQQYFDINSDEIISRLKSSLIPTNKQFLSMIESKPDLYGPFWIYTTLIFVIAASGSLTKYLHGVTNEEFFQEFVPLAASVIYGVGFCLPILVSILMKFFGSETPFMVVLCIYAYSFTVYIPIMFLCIPFEILQWILLLYAVGSSTIFLFLNFQEELNKYVDNKKYFVLGVVVIFQICLLLTLKLQFFASIKSKVIHRNDNTHYV